MKDLNKEKTNITSNFFVPYSFQVTLKIPKCEERVGKLVELRKNKVREIVQRETIHSNEQKSNECL